MSNYQPLNHRYLFSKLSKYAGNGLTGRLNIKIKNTACWHIYFNTGSIIWASGGVHPVRRWLRQLQGCHSQISLPEGMSKEELLSVPHECWDYFALALLIQENHLNPEQVKYIVEGVISEVLFDVVQGFAQVSPEEVDQIKMYRKQEATPCNQQLLPPAWKWETEAAKQRILLTWQSWITAGLDGFSPNIGIVANQEELSKQKFNSLTKYFLKIQEQKKTLRDLAVDNERNVLSILRTMKSYLNQNLIKFQSVPDLWESAQNQISQYSSLGQEKYTGLVAQASPNQASEEVTQIYPKARTGLDTSFPHSLDPLQPSTQLDVLRTRSGDLRAQEGVKVNIMEVLVSQEVERQLKALPPAAIAQINQLDVATYALNRLPPLYAASQEGIAHQREEANRKYQEAITSAVQSAIATVQKNPIRHATRILSPDEIAE